MLYNQTVRILQWHIKSFDVETKIEFFATLNTRYRLETASTLKMAFRDFKQKLASCGEKFDNLEVTINIL